MRIIGFLRTNLGLVTIGAALLAVVVIAGVLSSAGEKDIVLIVSGETMHVRTNARTVAAALRDADVDLGPDDIVLPGLESILEQGGSIEVLRARLVLVEDDGRASWVYTAQDDPFAILADGGISLEPGDRLWVDGIRYSEDAQALPARPSQLRVRRAVGLSLHLDGEGLSIRSAAPTLGEALWEGGIDLLEGDELTPPAETPLSSHMSLSLQRSRPIRVEVDGGWFEARVVASTVGDALDSAGIALVGQDYAIPDVAEALPDGGEIRVVRVREQVLLEQQPIPFGSLYQAAPDLEIDRTELLSSGSYGLKASRVRVRYENGIETARIVESEWVVREAEPRIVGYGTKIVIRTLSTPDGPIEYWRAVEMFATSYSPCGHGAGPTVCIYITRSGLPVAKGTVALLPEWYRYMALTHVYVPGYGQGTVGDTGWGIPGRHWIDLAYTDEDYVPWARYVTVYFLTPVPASIMWILES